MTRASRLDAILRQAQENHIVLQERGTRIELWSAGAPVPQPIRRAISRNRKEVLKRLALSTPEVCPSPKLHGPPVYLVCRWCCPVCANLRPWTLWDIPLEGTDDKKAG